MRRVRHNPSCPVCGGPGVKLGGLGNLNHFRCRNCGMDFSKMARRKLWGKPKPRKTRRNARYWSGYSKKDLSLYYKDLLPDERRSALAAARESLRWANTGAERKKIERHMKRLTPGINPKRRRYGKRRR